MGQDSHWLQDIKNISPAHHWYCSYGRWCSRPRVWPWSWTCLFLVKRKIWTWKCCCVCVRVCFIFSSSHLAPKRNPYKTLVLCHLFEKNLTPSTWFYKFPFGCCSDGPLCLKPALLQQQNGGGVAVSTSPCLGPLSFFVWTFFSSIFLPSPTPRIL